MMAFRGILNYNTAMSRIDNSKYYNEVVQRHGVTARGVHWNSQKTQYKRFEILLEMIDLSAEESVVDVGCGFADLYLYMQKKSTLPYSYVGLEIMESMVDEARKRVDCEIRVCDALFDPLPKADYYICSGAMNILTREETTLFIRRCLNASTKGFVFNLLEGEDESLVYNYYRPEEIEAVAKELGVSYKVKQGYLPRDFTVLFLKTALSNKEHS
ncbi:MAG: class I SAM-dependent methyltransferase [Helicobacteraceae bacterium]|jgi:SAM-dependent methyltransferase|nr:class I SAM-dependent methyltransferase [Helicobacteraceae bacterium]